MRTITTGVEFPLIEGEIISPDDFRKMVQQDDLRTQTLKWEKEYRCAVENELAFIRSQAYSEGFREGLHALSEVGQALREREAKLETAVTDVVETCLRRVFDQVPRRDLFKSIVAEVLEEVRTDQALTIQCHPNSIEDIRVAVDAWRNTVSKAMKGPELLFDCDEDLEADRCVIYASDEIMTAGIQILLSQLIDSLSQPTLPPKSIVLCSSSENS